MPTIATASVGTVATLGGSLEEFAADVTAVLELRINNKL